MWLRFGRKMTGAIAMLVWLSNLWTWFKALFRLRRVKAPLLNQSRSGARVRSEQLHSNEGPRESALTTFLSSLSEEGTRRCINYYPQNDGFRLSGFLGDEMREISGDEATHREFLAAVASSKVASCRSIYVTLAHDKFNSPKQLEEMAGALACSNNFKSVDFSFDRGNSALQMAECASTLLLGNKALEELRVALKSEEVVGREAGELLAKGLHGNRVLKSLHLSGIWGLVSDEAMEVLMKPLKDNDCALECLRIGMTTDAGLEHVGVMLGTNTSLRQLSYWDWDRNDEVYVRRYTSLKEALCINRSLKRLDCTVRSSTELKVLLEPLMPMNSGLQANTTLTTLWLRDSSVGGKEGVDMLVDMIRTNISLEKLYLVNMRELDDGCPQAVDNTVVILEALKTNKSLKTMGFWLSKGVGGYKVLGTMMDLLLENHQLEEIDLFGIPLLSSGDAACVRLELEKRKKLKLWNLKKGMANGSPKSGRVFMCGDPCAGKTTLRKSMKEAYHKDFQKKKISRFPFVYWTKKKYTPKVSNKAMFAHERTQGIEVDHMECDGLGISIWDMAGQADYHSFHDLVVPNLSADGSCSLFLLMCNPMDKESLKKRNISKIQVEIEYWLRFITSNTRRSWSYRPHVSIVMTHFDHWNGDIGFGMCLEDIVKVLKVQFQDVLEFDMEREIFKVNGTFLQDACKVFDFIKTYLKQLLTRLPKTIQACLDVQCLLSNWNAKVLQQVHEMKTHKLPVLKWEEFSNEICKNVEELCDVDKELAQRKQELVALTLHDGGHIIYHEEGKFIITDPQWFCHDIIGELLHYCSDSQWKIDTNDGIIQKKYVKHILLNILGSQEHKGSLDEILSMMKKLHICYEQDDNNIMMPSILPSKCQSLNWHAIQESTRLTYVGRRLSCKDVKQTMFTLGFFPRLQVSFFEKFENNNVRNSYQLFQDVIMFIYDGIEVIIEFDRTNINILLRSKEQCQDEMLHFCENCIVAHIRDLLSNPTLGCAGVILVQYILRPQCAKHLIDSKGEQHQFVSMKELELEVITSGFDATHNWKHCGELRPSYNKVKDLLGSKAWEELLQRRFEVLQGYEKEVVNNSSSNNSLNCKDEMWYARPSLIQVIPQRFKDFMLKEVHEKLDVIIKKVDNMQKDITKIQEDLLCKVSSRLDGLMEFSMEMQQAQVPKLVYLSEVGKKKLLTRLIPGLMEFELHLMCESKSGVHKVLDQEGCKVMFGTHETKTFVTMLVWGLKTATILAKIGAHVGGGMGGMVPNFGEWLQLGSLVLDTPKLLDGTFVSCLRIIASNEVLEISHNDRLKAEEWVVQFLEPKCKEKASFYEMFKLRKVVYKDNAQKPSTAWICDNCRSKVLYNKLA